MPLTLSLNVYTHPDIKHCARLPHPPVTVPKTPLYSLCLLQLCLREQWSSQLLDWHYHGINFRRVTVMLSWQSSPSWTIATTYSVTLIGIGSKLPHCCPQLPSWAQTSCHSIKEANPSNVRTLAEPQLFRCSGLHFMPPGWHCRWKTKHTKLTKGILKKYFLL